MRMKTYLLSVSGRRSVRNGSSYASRVRLVRPFGVLAYDGKMLVFTASAESVGEMTFDLLVSVSGSEQQGATLHIWIPVGHHVAGG